MWRKAVNHGPKALEKLNSTFATELYRLCSVDNPDYHSDSSHTSQYEGRPLNIEIVDRDTHTSNTECVWRGQPTVNFEMVDENDYSREVRSISCENLPGVAKITDKATGDRGQGYITKEAFQHFLNRMSHSEMGASIINDLVEGKTDMDTAKKRGSAYLKGNLNRWVIFTKTQSDSHQNDQPTIRQWYGERVPWQNGSSGPNCPTLKAAVTYGRGSSSYG